MIVSEPIGVEVEADEIRTQYEELPQGEGEDAIVAEEDPVIPPFSPPGS